VAAQHSDDGARFVDLGLAENALTITGNIKFDLSLDQAVRGKAQQLLSEWRSESERPILLAASTHRGEDEIILEAFAQIKTRIENLLLSAGFNLARRSSADKVEGADILLGDTMGELMTFFGACDIAFVGGSLVPIGGHNVIEPAAWGVPVLTGPHLFNFTEASQLLLDGEALLVCNDAKQLAEQCITMLNSQQRREQMGSQARLIAEANRGALDKLIGVIDRFI
jgi:3-deoxy-D-manno-octulosonic-acid transferase